METTMEKKKITQRTLNTKEKLAGVSFMKEVVVKINLYLTRAIQTANEENQVTREEFWDHLFCPSYAEDSETDKKKKYYILDTKKLDRKKCPENPYQKLDFQGSNKYLLYGTRRELPSADGKVRYAQDSLNYCKKFNLPYTFSETKPKKNGPSGKYRKTLWDSIIFRNEIYAHDTPETVLSIDLVQMNQWMQTLEELTEPLTRKEDWNEGRLPLKEFWKHTKEAFNKQFGTEPLSLQEVGQELFTTEEELSQQQRQALEAAAEWLNLDCQDGWVYQEERKKLLRKLRSVPKIAELLGAPAWEAPQEVQCQKVISPETAQPLPGVLWEVIPPAAAKVLRRAGTVLPPDERVLSALLDTFTLLVDESIFMAPEGRELITEHLAPLLMKRHGKLVLDESVADTLFRMFRGSVPYTELELTELRKTMEEEEIGAMQKLREQLHADSKNAIKTLRFLRERRCLEVAASPTESTNSYENFYYLAHAFPQQRFLVLSLERQLAEELKKAPGSNAVVMKIGLDGGLLPLRATRQVFQGMLSGHPAPAAERRPEPQIGASILPQSVPSAQSVQTGKTLRPGDRVSVCWPDGSRKELYLGKLLGEGGEGAIYETGERGMVLKIYFPKQRDDGRREKLSHMVAYDPKIPNLCWPKALAETQEGEWVGYLMPRAQGKELALTAFHPGRNNSTLTALGWTRRSLALIAANIADTFRQMHEKGILMGDINPRNFIVGEDCSVYLVDCDSYQFENFPCPVGTPLYTPPEVHREMKAANRENYGYIRTEDNERYSLAVLLFEILMLGKAPYESRNTNNQDVIDAIMAGNFPYPYNVQRGDDADDKEPHRQSGVKAPVGRWRQIWSNTTYMVKTKFYNTFTGKGRTSAAEWARVLQEYARQIELGHSSDALVPDGFKDTSGREGSDDTKMVDLVCEMCGKTFNLAEDVYQARMQRGEPILCATHWEFRKNMGRRMISCTCSVCGKSFDTTAREWIQQSRAGKDMVCRECADREIRVSCSKCGREYWEKQRKVQALQAQGSALLCTDCLPWVVCDVCGEKFRTPRENLEKRRQRHQKVLCQKCRTERRTEAEHKEE